MSEPAARGRLAGAVLVLAALLAVLALVLSYSARALLRAEPFADRAVAALRDPAVQEDLAERLSDAIVSSGKGDLATVRPLVRTFSGAVVASAAFAALFRTAVLDTHRTVVEHHGATIQLNVADAGVLLQGALERLDPKAAQTVGAERVSRLLTLHPGSVLLSIVRAAERARSAAWVLALLALLAAAGALWLAPERRRACKQLALALALGGLAVVLAADLGRVLAEGAVSSGHRAVVGAVWTAFLGGLRTQALWLAAAGAVCAAAASGRLRPGRLDQRIARGVRLLTGPQPTRPRRLARGGALAIVGAAVVFEPATALTIAAQAGGLYALYRGIEALLSETALPHESSARAQRRGVASPRRLIGPAVAIVALGGLIAILASGDGDGAPTLAPLTCNGHVQLCARPLNDVAFAATHNSMASVTIPTWLFGQQDGTIAEQLEHGVRGLLIDTYHGEAVPGGVRTELGRIDSSKREAAEREIGAPAVDAALRIRARLGHQGEGTPGIFLCHTFCELGAITLASALADVRSFLVENPGEVLVIVNQDEGVSPLEMQQAFSEAGLLDLVYRGPAGPFPTLRTMIDSNQRLLVMAENEADPHVPWYHLAYAHALHETPFHFTRTAQLTEPTQLPASCAANRGPASAPLLLINNWIDTSPAPRASLAAEVNARGPLLARVNECQRVRRQLPNLIAVDFFRRGDLLGVVDALNGVGPGAAH